MIPKEARSGDDTAGLLYYLYGPGKRDEHVNPHIVAAWDPFIPDPARSEDFSISDLAALLDAPVHALLGKKPPLHVFHTSVRNDPKDRQLSDEEWGRVAREMMHVTGFAPYGDDHGCRWVAIRHADDHIHIVATRARENGRQPVTSWTKIRMQEAARKFEVEFGLRRLKHGDRTARKWPETGEQEKAVRRGLSEPVRETLQRTVREAAAAAVGDEDFFARLTASGLRIKQRIAPDGNVTGYSVAMPGDRDGGQTPVWFSGARLAPDLSLPRVRERWQSPVSVPVVAPAEMWQEAERRVRAAADQLGVDGLHQGAGDVAALGDLIVIAAVVSPRMVRGRLKGAAYEFERASRAPGDRKLDGQARALYRESAHLLSRSATMAGRSDTVATLGFLLAMVTAIEASGRWHEAREHRAQAEASGRAGRLLREAVEVTAGAAAAKKFKARGKRAGVRRSGDRQVPEERPMAGVVQKALVGRAGEVLADPAWPALRSRLVEVERAGEDPAEVLAAVAGQRELGTADSITEVLSWRLDGWQRQRGAMEASFGSRPSTTAAGGAGTATARKSGAPGARRRPPGGEQTKGPRRAR